MLQGFRGTIHEVDSKTAGKSYAINGIVSQVRRRRLLAQQHTGINCPAWISRRSSRKQVV